MVVNLLIFLGVPLAMFVLAWLILGGPPDPTDRDEHGHTPW
jgi:hypothetical protein